MLALIVFAGSVVTLTDFCNIVIGNFGWFAVDSHSLNWSETGSSFLLVSS